VRCYYSTNNNNFTLFHKNHFESLVADLQSLLAPIKTQDDVDIKMTMNLLRLYRSDESQWARYALRDPQRAYTRNYVAQTSPISDLLVLVWEPGKSSKVHNHPNSNCFVKVLKGTLHENQYHQAADSNQLELTRQIEVPCDAVTYITDNIGVHKMENKSSEVVVTLHLYVPGYASASTYDSNGVVKVVDTSSFYSINGEINSAVQK
jgi:cysteine dioxygenase